MKFTSGFLAIAAAVPSALAVEFTNSAYTVVAGQPFTLTWADASGPVTITLKDGASTDLKDVEVLATGLTTTSFTWTPDSSLPSDTYAFEIEDSTGVPNYSSQFQFEGSASASASATTASATSTSATTGSSTVSSTASMTSSASSSATTDMSSSLSGSSSATGTASTDSTSTDSSATSTSSTMKTSTTSKSTSAASTDSSATSTSTPVNTNDSKKLGSPLALILGTVISLMVFN